FRPRHPYVSLDPSALSEELPKLRLRVRRARRFRSIQGRWGARGVGGARSLRPREVRPSGEAIGVLRRVPLRAGDGRGPGAGEYLQVARGRVPDADDIRRTARISARDVGHPVAARPDRLDAPAATP